MTVGYFSPLPPARSGVADYSAELLRALAPLGSVTVNACDADVPLYHLGNNPLHSEIYGHALKTPGVAVLHDAVLHHFFLGAGDERQYVAEFVYNYGHWSEDLARELWRRRSRSAADPEYFRYPMIKRVVERSRAVIVHNPRAAALVHEHVRGAAVHEIPLLFELPNNLPAASEVIRWRAKLGVPASTFLVRPAHAQMPKEEATISELHAAYLSGKVTAVQVVQFYLNRIKAYDQSGPKLNVVIALNPKAVSSPRTGNFTTASTLFSGQRN